MATPSVTYTFNNGTTADAGQVNTNFTDVINALVDGNNDLSIGALTCSGTATLNGNVVLGNAGADDLTISASLASSIPIKTNDSYDIGSATLGLQNVFLGGTGGTTAIKGAASITTYTITTPGTVGVAGQALGNSGSGALEWIMSQTLVTAKSAAYTITDIDKIRTIPFTTGASSFDVTLPTAGDNTNRIITVKKVDSGVGICTVKGEGAGETIEGVSGTTGYPLTFQWDGITVQSNGSVWFIIGYSTQNKDSSTPSGTITGGTISGTSLEARKSGDIGSFALTYTVGGSPSGGVITFASGSIPLGFRPLVDFYVTTEAATGGAYIDTVRATTAGLITIIRRDWAGSTKVVTTGTYRQNLAYVMK